MKILYLLTLFTFFQFACATEFGRQPADIEAETILEDVLGEDFDVFKSKLNKIDVAILKMRSRRLCEFALYVQKDDRFILALLEREADLGINLQEWAEMIMTLSKDSLRKKLVVGKHSQQDAIKCILLEREAESLANSCVDYSTEDKNIILDKLEAKLAAQEEAKSKVAQFFQSNKTASISLSAGSIIAFMVWKWRSKNTQNNSSNN